MSTNKKTHKIFGVTWSYYIPGMEACSTPYSTAKLFGKQSVARQCFESQRDHMLKDLRRFMQFGKSEWQVLFNNDTLYCVCHPLGMAHGYIKIMMRPYNVRSSWTPDSDNNV